MGTTMNALLPLLALLSVLVLGVLSLVACRSLLRPPRPWWQVEP